MLDVDTTIKPLYGEQEGAELGYNPAQARSAVALLFRNSDRLLRDRDRRFESLSLRKRVCCQRTADRVR